MKLGRLGGPISLRGPSPMLRIRVKIPVDLKILPFIPWCLEAPHAPDKRSSYLLTNNQKIELSSWSHLLKTRAIEHPLYRACTIPQCNSYMNSLKQVFSENGMPLGKIWKLHLMLLFIYNYITFICTVIIICLVRRRSGVIASVQNRSDFSVSLFSSLVVSSIKAFTIYISFTKQIKIYMFYSLYFSWKFLKENSKT